MFRIFYVISLLIATTAFASPVEQAMSMKERLRISLWVEGLDSTAPTPLKTAQVKPVALPEEIERALSKM